MPPPHNEFTVGWICALPHELAASAAMFDEDFGGFDTVETGDTNTYHSGQIGQHKVVMAGLPGAGTVSAATAAANMLRSFPSIRFGLMVGIGGGVPDPAKDDIRLGDIVVSQPTHDTGGVVQYDFGKAHVGGRFERRGTLNKPPRVLLNGIRSLQSKHESYDSDIPVYLTKMLAKRPKMRTKYARPSLEADVLFESECSHPAGDECGDCGKHKVLIREARVNEEGQPDNNPRIHYGLIASGNIVIASAEERQRLCDMIPGVLCFEMEAAGLMDDFPCLVIRGVSDYADSYKRDEWQRYAAAAAAAYTKELLNVIPGAAVKDTKLAASKARVILPYPQNENFVGREQLLQAMRDQFARVRGNPRVALVGLGGVGKSQIAIEYAHETKQKSPETSILWVYAGSAARFAASCSSIAAQLKLPGFDDPEVNPAELVFQWLLDDNNGKWLLILDNVDDSSLVEEIQDYIPKKPTGYVLMTSRDRDAAFDLAGGADSVLDVDVMSFEEARTLIDRKIPDRSKGNDDDRDALARELELIPLAITQAAAHITRRQRMTIPAYMERLKDERTQADLLRQEFRGDLTRDNKVRNSVLATWQISFDHIRDHVNEQAADMLSLMSMLDRQLIPEFLLKLKFEKYAFEDAIEVLLGYSLVTEVVSGLENQRGFDMHNLVQVATQDWVLVAGLLDHHSAAALKLLLEGYPSFKYENWNKCQILEPHAQILLRRRKPVGFDDGRGRLQQSRTLYLTERGNYSQALSTGEESVRLTREVYGDEHLNTLISTDVFTVVLWRLGRVEEAEKLQMKILEAAKRTLGNTHSFIPEAMVVLAFIKSERGMWIEAERLNREILALRTQLGEDESTLLAAMSNLAVTYGKLGRFNEAESLEVHVLERRRDSLGSNHPKTMECMQHVASTWLLMGRVAEAQNLLLECVQTQKEILGEEHQSTLSTMSSLATAHNQSGQLLEAELLEVQVLQINERVFGMEHHSTLTSMFNLATTYAEQKRWKEAEDLCIRALEARKRLLGTEHPDTLLGMSSLSVLYFNQNGRFEEAESICKDLISLRRRVVGEDHPHTLDSTLNLAIAYNNLKRHGEALALLRPIIEPSKRTLGEEHPTTIATMSNLLRAYQELAMWNETEELGEIVVELATRVLGESHDTVYNNMRYLARAYLQQGRWSLAADLYEKLSIQSAGKNGEEHQETIAFMSLLGAAYQEQPEHIDQAVAIYEKLLNVQQKVHGAEHPETLIAMDNLETAYRAQKQWAKAANILRAAVDIRTRTLGQTHLHTLKDMALLSQTLFQQSQLSEVDAMDLKIWELTMAINGEEEAWRHGGMHDLAAIFFSVKALREAEAFALQALGKEKALLGPEHADSLRSLSLLVDIHTTQGRLGEAEKLRLDEVEMKTRTLGGEHPSTLRSTCSLAVLYQEQGKLEEAVQLAKQSLEGRIRELGEKHKDTLDGLKCLVEIYRKQGRAMEAEELLKYLA